ncbi:hypothetical protein [Mycobacterium shimoidei]|uniref:Uncharacterized protein n=1 Tax=Mycobacterium shimoidei TaxID=29313 RepID=A0A1E3T432_MYCSH|nr:hypothetical protein [Mycobacterium shimoidei]MCV7261171.1 hypothetical protein [Mycobacterium shimoidei]ODR08653.1 hypothetical protein BHQ16_20415 [Mycobacterium shimoidei]ORW82931.1 hypothetical protein AWC26_03750 [Mycobacterium shimoidei]SRX94877.1 hypothetical protein MSP7336_03140 [Mycobacterium shimoidei]
MDTVHPDLGPELRKLAQTILDGIDPAVRAAASRAAGSGAGPGRCQQVWCPVCALAAVVTGEQHPLLSVIAEHSVALLAVIRAIIADANGSTTPGPPEGPPDGGAAAEAPDDAGTKSRYQPISVTVDE